MSQAESFPIISESPSASVEEVYWDYSDIESSSVYANTVKKRQTGQIEDGKACPDGWARFKESCYYIEKEKMTMADAERSCFRKNSTMFVANSIDEWNITRKLTPQNFWSWVGLVRFEGVAQPEPMWQTTSGMNAAEINWLSKAYSPVNNGWTSASRCAAHFYSMSDSISYVFFYNCKMPFYSICERNVTFINMLNEY